MTEPLKIPTKESEHLAKRGQKSRNGVAFKYEGSEVKHLQEALLALGYSLPEKEADGQFGPETDDAVRDFQRDHNDLFMLSGGKNPPLKKDGVVGPETALALNCALARSGIWFDKYEYEWNDEEGHNRVCCIMGTKTSMNPDMGERVRLYIARVLRSEIVVTDVYGVVRWEEETPEYESLVKS